jgi:hypothetical protein
MQLDARTLAISQQGVGFFSIDLDSDVMIEAARQTLRHGFSHFTLSNPQESTQFAPSYYGGYRSGGYANGWIGNHRYGTASAIVHMSNGNPDALDARAILAREGE